MEHKSFCRLLIRGGVSLSFLCLLFLSCHAQDFSQEEIDRKLNLLENKLSTGEAEVSDLKIQIKELEKNNQTLSAEVEKKNKFIAQLQKDLVDSGQGKSASSSGGLSSGQKEKILQALEKAQAKLRQLNELNVSLYKKIKEKDTVISGLQKDQPQAYAELKDKLKELKNDISDRDKEIKGLRKDLSGQEKTFQKELSQKLKEKDELIDELQTSLDRGDSNLEQTLARREKEIESLRKDLSGKEKTFQKELSQKLKEKDELIDELQTSLDRGDSNLEQTLARKEKEIESLRLDLKRQKADYEKIMAEKKKTGPDLKPQPQSDNAELVSLRRKLSEKEKKIEELIIEHDKDVRQVTENIRAYQKRIEKQDKEIAGLKRKTGSAGSRPDRDKDGLSAQSRELARLKKNNAALSVRLEKASEYEQKLREKEKELAALQKENRALAAKVEDKVSVSIDRVSADKTVASLSRELKLKTDLLENLKQNYFNSSRKDKDTIDILEKEIAGLKKQTAQEDIFSSGKESQQSSVLAEQNRELQSALRYSEQEVKRLSSEIARNKKYLDDSAVSRGREEEFKARDLRLQSELKSAQNNVFTLQSLLQDKDAEIERLRRTMERVLAYMDALGDTSESFK